MTTEPSDLSIARVFNAPRALAYRAFTDPEQLAAWWWPTGSMRPLEEMDFDVGLGGYQRFVQVSPDDPSMPAEVHLDLTGVSDGRVLDGVMRAGGHLPGGFEPFETQFRFEFYDDLDARTRLQAHQWLPAHVTGATETGWHQSFAELDALLAKRAAV